MSAEALGLDLLSEVREEGLDLVRGGYGLCPRQHIIQQLTM